MCHLFSGIATPGRLVLFPQERPLGGSQRPSSSLWHLIYFNDHLLLFLTLLTFYCAADSWFFIVGVDLNECFIGFIEFN